MGRFVWGSKLGKNRFKNRARSKYLPEAQARIPVPFPRLRVGLVLGYCWELGPSLLSKRLPVAAAKLIVQLDDRLDLWVHLARP